MGDYARVKLESFDTEIVRQIREADPEVVDEYADEYKKGTAMPPVTAVRDGSRLWLTDGLHRTEAAKLAEMDTINCKVIEGTRADAIKGAAGSNHDHGVPRTQIAKRNAVQLILSQKQWEKATDRFVAETAKVSHTFVANVRKSLGLKTSPRKTAKCKAGEEADETNCVEEQSDTKPKKETDAVNGIVVYDWSQFAASVGSVIRKIDEMAKPFGLNNSEEADAFRRRLRIFYEDVGSWYEKVSGAKPVTM